MKSEVLDSIGVQIEICQGVDYVMEMLPQAGFSHGPKGKGKLHAGAQQADSDH
jgi:hypothetical protein